MTESELDVLWQHALRESVAAGEQFTRYRFAALVRAQVIEEAAQTVEAMVHGNVRTCAAAIRGMKSDSGHSTARAGEASTARHSECRWPECSCYAPQGRGLCRYSPGASTAPLPEASGIDPNAARKVTEQHPINKAFWEGVEWARLDNSAGLLTGQDFPFCSPSDLKGDA